MAKWGKNSRLNLQAKKIFLNAGKYFYDLQVVGIYKYLRDGYYDRVLYIHEEKPSIFLYDIVLSDNRNRLKCFLAPKMYNTVQTGKLRVGTTIRIKKTYTRGIRIILEDFDITGIKNVTDTSNLPYLLHFDTREVQAQPLYAMRSYYLGPWLEDIPYGNHWTNVAHSLTERPQFESSSCITLKELEKHVRTKKESCPQLLVTVLHRGRFHHYGKPSTSKACPFQGHLLLADHSAICGAILWDERNIGTHWHIKPGDKILLKNYTTSVCYMYKRYMHRFEKPNILALEISLNYKSVINRVNDDDIPVGIRKSLCPFPYPVYRFVPRNLLGSIHHGKKVDVVGYVTYVGHCFKVKDRNPKFEGQHWVAYQWIEMLDDTSKFPIRIKLHFSYQLNEQEIITPGQLLLCTYLRVIRQNMNSSFAKMHFFLKSTNNTLILSHLPKDVMRENRIQKFLQWVKKTCDHLQSLQILVCRVAGFSGWKSAEDLTVPRKPLKASIHKSVNCNSVIESRNVMFLHGEHWKSELANLEVRECKSVVIRGSVSQVTYLRVECKSTMSEQLYTSRPKKDCTLASEHWQLAFPRLYLLGFKKELQSFLQLPAFSSEQVRTLLTEEQLGELPFFPSEGYIIVIKSDTHPISISTVFFPNASKCPHPSLENLLKKNYQTKELFLDEECHIETAMYTLEQNDRLTKTAKEIECKRFFFKLDFYCYAANKTIAILNKAL